MPGTAAAFFDLDRTLIAGSANFPLAVAAFRRGLVPPRDLVADLRNAVTFLLRGADDARSEALRDRILRAVAGAEVDTVVALGDDFIPQLAASVLPEARRLLATHADRGEDRFVVSASPIEIVARLAESIGLEGGIGTVSEVSGGRYTGRLAGEFCYGPGKVAAVRTVAAERGYDLAASYAYSDSISDLPFLELVGHPVAVNPDAELRVLARQRSWPVVEVSHRSRVRLPFVGRRAA